MRRFELVDGKSAKFWEVEVDGSDLNLRWGRIGTDGQTKLKTLDDEAKAEKEAEKLIKSKTKKGYAEVASGDDASGDDDTGDDSGEATAAAAPAAAPAPAPSAPATPPVAAASAPKKAAAPEKAAPPRESRVTKKLSDLARSWAKPEKPPREIWEALRSDMSEEAGRLERGVSVAATPEGATLTGDLAKILMRAEPDLDVEMAAALLSKLTSSAWPYLSARFAPVDLVRIVVALGGYEVKWHYQTNASSVEPRFTESNRSNLSSLVCDTSSIADGLTDEEFAAVLAEADAAWSSWPVAQRARVATVLAREPRLVRQLLDEESTYDYRHTPAFGAISALEDGLRLAKATVKQSNVPDMRLFAHTAARIGPDVVAIAEALMSRVESWGQHTLTDVVALVESPEGARLFADLLEHRELKRKAREYLERVPWFAIPALASSRKVMSRSVLEVLVRAHPEVVDELRGSLDDAQLAVVEAIYAKSVVSQPDASPDELPTVLTDPPWKRPKKKGAAKPVTLALTAIEMPAAMEWRPGQREAWMREHQYSSPSAEGTKNARAALALAQSRADQGQYTNLYLGRLLNAEDEALVEIWNSITKQTLDWAPGEAVKKLVARLEEKGIPGYLELAKKNAPSAAEHLSRLRSPQLAPFYAKVLAGRSKQRSHAQSWLESFPEEAAAGLIPDALGKPKKERAAAEAAIAYLGQKGHAEPVLAIAKRYGDEVVAPVTAILERDPLDGYPKKIKKLPAWIDTAGLPRPLLKGREKAIPKACVEPLVTMVAFSPLDPPYVGIEQVIEACDRESLFELAWGLFSAWLGADGSSQNDWAMLALGHFGGDEAARRLTPLIRKWPGEAAHARAVKALEVLSTIGSDVALMHLHGISQKLKFKGLKKKAGEKVEQIAEARGLTAEELADRLVPDLDLDERGTMVLDYGPRKFTVGFDESLKPFVLDEDDKARKELPKPGKKDAPEAKEVQKRWKALKKDARAVAKNQITRLESLMCSGRRVTMEVFQPFFVDHPLVTHLVQRLVWGWFPAAPDESVESGAPPAGLGGAFRVNDERAFVDGSDEPVTIPEGAEIGLMHPLLLDEPTRAAFGEQLADYEILQPFEQLGRPIFLPTAEEETGSTMARFAEVSVPLGKVRGLEQLGWNKGMPQDAGIIWDMTKPIPGTGLEVVMTIEPGFSADGVDWGGDMDTQKLSSLSIREKGRWSGSEPLSRLTAAQFSELVRDMTITTSES